MSFKGLARLPNFVDCEVVRVTILLKNLEAEDARVLAAVGRKFADEYCGLIKHLAPAGDIDVGHRVEIPVVAGREATA